MDDLFDFEIKKYSLDKKQKKFLIEVGKLADNHQLTPIETFKALVTYAVTIQKLNNILPKKFKFFKKR